MPRRVGCEAARQVGVAPKAPIRRWRLYGLVTSYPPNCFSPFVTRLGREIEMVFFQDAAVPADLARDFEERAPPRVALLVIAGLSALSWGVVAAIAMAVRVVL